MEAILTLGQAGHQLGVDDTTLTRLIQMGALPEARPDARADGTVWTIPQRDLPSIAARNGWTIDLRGRAKIVAPAPPQVPVQPPMPSSGPPPHPKPATAKPVAASSVTADSSAEVTQLRPATPSTPQRETVDQPGPVGHLSPAGALVPRPDQMPTSAAEATTSPVVLGPEPTIPSVSEVLDLALLDRLLGAHEDRVLAEVKRRESQTELSNLDQANSRLNNELEVERQERMVAADRFREERTARAVADAKITELRERVAREQAMAEAERQAKSEAVHRTVKAERAAANALASMGWLGRRRYRRIIGSPDDR